VSPAPEQLGNATPPAAVLSLSQVRDLLEDLRRPDLAVEPRRALVDQLAAYLSARESSHALQQLLDQVAVGLAASGDVAEEMTRWRPLVERCLAAETARAEVEARRVSGDHEIRRGLVQWVAQVVDAKTVLILLAIAAAATGIKVSLPGGISVASVAEVPAAISSEVP
jgi:hypothetical protein